MKNDFFTEKRVKTAVRVELVICVFISENGGYGDWTLQACVP